MLKARRRWLLSGIALCAAVIALAVVQWQPSRLPDGRAADTREQYAQRRLWMVLFDGAVSEGLDYNNARAREAAARESLAAMEIRLAETSATYDFAWRAHRPAADIAALEAHDRDAVGPHDARHQFDNPSRPLRQVTLERPGIWVVRPTDPKYSRSDAYIIRVAVHVLRPYTYWKARANFRLVASAGVTTTTLKCQTFQTSESLDSFGYCIVPTPTQRADPVADSALLDRLTALQNGAPPPVMTGAEVAASLKFVRSGDLAAEHRHIAADFDLRLGRNGKREGITAIAAYTAYAIAVLILLALPASALALAISARRSTSARVGSRVFGLICACLASAAICLPGTTGGWGLRWVDAFIAFALSAGLAALICLVGVVFGKEKG